MAIVKLNPVIERVRGRIGDLVFMKRFGSMFISRTPDTSNRVFSVAQIAVQERFRLAVLYGRAVMADPQARAAYVAAAKEQKRPVFSLMIADFFHAPEVHEIDLSAYTGQSGSSIGVRATDDFEVMGVDVAITNASGDPIEGGAAVKSTTDSGKWVYVATTSVPSGTPIRVEVTATDRPGNKGTKVANA